jgi:hypothetical protein
MDPVRRSPQGEVGCGIMDAAVPCCSTPARRPDAKCRLAACTTIYSWPGTCGHRVIRAIRLGGLRSCRLVPLTDAPHAGVRKSFGVLAMRGKITEKAHILVDASVSGPWARVYPELPMSWLYGGPHTRGRECILSFPCRGFMEARILMDATVSGPWARVYPELPMSWLYGGPHTRGRECIRPVDASVSGASHVVALKEVRCVS